MIWLSIFIFYKAPGQVVVRSVSPYSSFQYRVTTNGTDKEDVLKKMENGIMPIYTNAAEEKVYDECLLLDGETSAYAIEICNDGKTEEAYTISTNLPEDWNVAVRRFALLPDFYTYQQKNNSDIMLYGDALPKLEQKRPRNWDVVVKPREVVRIFIVYTAHKSSIKGINQLEVFVKKGDNLLSVKKMPIRLAEKGIPKVDFNSVIFNNNTYQIASFANELVKTGFSHAISYTPPSAIFNKEGELIGPLIQNTENSKEFRYVSNYWAGRGMPILFYWTAHFAKLAALSDNTYLTPYSPEFNKAYVNLVKQAYLDIKSRIPEFKPSQVLLYVHDEVSSGEYTEKVVKEVMDIRSLLKTIKEELPEFKTFLTFGFYTYPVDLQAVMPYTDIAVSHIFMPNQLKRNAPASYNPAVAVKQNLYSKFRNINSDRISQLKKRKKRSLSSSQRDNSSQLWSYLVTEGKTSNVLDFRALPLYAIILGREGLSWWAFSSTRGSSWFANDKNSLDYSMIYRREGDNPVYQFWCKDTSETVIPSIRLYAARAGIQDAKLLRYITENVEKLSNSEFSKLKIILDDLAKGIDSSGTQPDREKYLGIDQYESISQRLRGIYVAMLE